MLTDQNGQETVLCLPISFRKYRMNCHQRKEDTFFSNKLLVQTIQSAIIACAYPANISNIKIPSAHQSTAFPCPLLCMISGARYSGVPHSVQVLTLRVREYATIFCSIILTDPQSALQIQNLLIVCGLGDQLRDSLA